MIFVMMRMILMMLKTLVVDEDGDNDQYDDEYVMIDIWGW